MINSQSTLYANSFVFWIFMHTAIITKSTGKDLRVLLVDKLASNQQCALANSTLQ